MGAGITYALLNAGISTVTIERDHAGAGAAAANVGRLIDDGVKRGVLDTKAAEDINNRHLISTDFASAKDAQIAIEAAYEDMQVKTTIFEKLDKVMPADAVLATNTSYLDINHIAKALKCPERLIGLHFFVPAHVMKLLEIVKGEASSDTALAQALGLQSSLKNTSSGWGL